MKAVRILAVVIFCIVIFTSLSNLSYAGEGAFGFDSHIDRINKEQKAGKITNDEAVYRRFQGLLDPDELPGRYRGAPIESATFELMDLQSEARKVMDPKFKTLLGKYTVSAENVFQRGMGYTDSVAMASKSFYLSNLTSSYSPSTSNFTVWYTQSGVDAVPAADIDPANGVPDYVDKVSYHLNYNWNFQVSIFGQPPGTSSKYNVFLKNLKVSKSLLYGLTMAGGRDYSWPSFIIMENDFINFPGSVEDNIRATVAHEFFHAIHFGYNPFHTDKYKENRWFAEASAVWIESKVYPWLRSYIDFAYRSEGHELQGWFADPELSLTTWDDNSRLRQYGSSIFLQLLDEEKGGVSLIKNIWTGLKNRDMSAPGTVIRVIDSKLRNAGKGTFNSFLARFSNYNFNVSGYKERTYIKADRSATPLWAGYPFDIYVMNPNGAIYSSYPFSRSYSTNDKPLPQYLGANYHVFKASSAGKTFYFKAGKDLLGLKAGKWIVNLLLRKKGTNTYIVKRVMNPAARENFLAVPGFNNIIYDRAVVVAVVVGPAGNSSRYTYNLSAKHISTSSLRSSKSTVISGGQINLRGALSPKHANMGNVYVQKSVNGISSWSNLGKMSWDSSAQKYIFTHKPTATRFYRLFWRGDTDHGPSRSNKVKVTVQ